MGKLLAVDLDGTLFYPKSIKTCIPKKNILFLRRWIDEGNQLVLVTSRSAQFIQLLKAEIDREFDYIVCSSSEIYHKDKVISATMTPNKELSEVLEKIDKAYSPLAYMMTTRDYPCIIKPNRDVSKFLLFFYRLWQIFQFKRGEPCLISKENYEQELKSGMIFKIMIFFGIAKGKNKLTRELNKELRLSYPMMEFSWSTKVIEITPFGCNKGQGLDRYCSTLGINKDDVIVVGDSGNDISMFNVYYENSYCMKHAYTSVRKYAKHTVSRVYKLEKMLLKGEK